MPKATVIGTTSWGTTLGTLLADKGVTVHIWARTEAEASELNQGRNLNHLSYLSDPAAAVAGADLVIMAVPSASVRQNIQRIKSHLSPPSLIMSAAKGLELSSSKRMSEVIAEEVGPSLSEGVCVISGPNLSKEITGGLPAFTVVAAASLGTARRAQRLLHTPRFMVRVSKDMVGVELGGALKNVIALLAGMVDGLELGNNAKAAYMSLGWSEVINLAVAMGAKRHTLYGLAGLGDLIATCSSTLSRNHQLGERIARGSSLAEAVGANKHAHQIAEGVGTAMAAHNLAKARNVRTPVIDMVYGILYEGHSCRDAFADFGKSGKPE